jgi:hypothetical protein
MTKEKAIAKIEKADAKVLNCRMKNGTPKVTISWRDYGKVRNMQEVTELEILIAMR